MGEAELTSCLAALDERATVDRLDPQGALGRIEALPEQCEQAWGRAAGLRLPDEHRAARGVVLLGMGGSAIAGDILCYLATRTGGKPARVVRGYDVPNAVGERTLVVACSHSGNTEETLSAFRQAVGKGAKAFAITTGGELKKLADDAGAPAFVYEYDGEPRSAIGHQLMALLALGEQAGLVTPQASAVAEAVALMKRQRAALDFDSPFNSNPAKQLASRLHDRLPVIVGAGVLEPAAYRWKTQINENAESWAVHETLPEFGHNTIVGLALPREVVALVHAVLLWHPSLASLARHYEAIEAEMDEAGVAHERFEVAGESLLAQTLAACHAGDFVSYYLALLNGVSPAPMAAIDRLKARLSKHEPPVASRGSDRPPPPP